MIVLPVESAESESESFDQTMQVALHPPLHDAGIPCGETHPQQACEEIVGLPPQM